MAVKTTYFFGSYSSKRPFIIQINSGADSSFTIPTSGGGYNYKVSTSDGQNFTGVTGNLTITFPSANTLYDISISGDFPRIYFNNTGDKGKIIDIKQWGDIEWGSNMANAFYGCSDMTCSALDSPNLENLTIGTNMFRDCSSFNPTNFNPTLGNLTNGTSMFLNCSSFNPTNFNPTLGSLTIGVQMFYNCSSFNPTNFNPTLGNLTNGTYMFSNCSLFNPTNFNPTLGNLTNGTYMFRDCSSFNPTNFNPTLGNLTNGTSMFRDCSDFTRDIMFDDPINGTVNLQSTNTMFYMIKSKKIWMQAGALTTVDVNSFRCSLLEDFRLIGMSVSFTIRYSPNLVGSKIDDLFTSLGTANIGATITISTAQSTSGIDTTIATNKGWTIVIV